MRSITETFERLRAERRKALIPYLTAGFPGERLFMKLAAEFMDAGADIMEIGVPFSDPVADGRSIQYSSQSALRSGINLDRILAMAGDLGRSGTVPLVFMSYYNPILAYGVRRFARRAGAAGVKGLIIPDMIPEEGEAAGEVLAGEGIDLIYLLAPTSSGKRRRMIIARSRGFVYLVSVAGVTGGRARLPATLNTWVRGLKSESPLPVCVGFGISTPGQARSVSRAADGVIVGSAIIDLIRGEPDSAQVVRRAGSFIRRLRQGMDNGGS
jgi:tryptophan synthase alpha chain